MAQTATTSQGNRACSLCEHDASDVYLKSVIEYETCKYRFKLVSPMACAYLDCATRRRRQGQANSCSLIESAEDKVESNVCPVPHPVYSIAIASSPCSTSLQFDWPNTDGERAVPQLTQTLI